MSCGCQQNDPFGVGCCCGNANVGNHCASSAFDSSCTDEGQGYPVSYPAGCKVFDYTPVHGVVAHWNGTEWVLNSDSSSTDSSSSIPIPSTISVTLSTDGGPPQDMVSGVPKVSPGGPGSVIDIYACNSSGSPAQMVGINVDDPDGVLSDYVPVLVPLAVTDCPMITTLAESDLDGLPGPHTVTFTFHFNDGSTFVAIVSLTFP